MVVIKKRFKFTIPFNLLSEPLLSKLGTTFCLGTRVIEDHTFKERWMLLELIGQPDNFEDALRWVKVSGFTMVEVS